MLNTLMERLSYPHYLITNSGAASASPAEIDWKLANYLASQYPNSCLGAHFISPPLVSPKIHQAPWEWTKWSIANFFHEGILGYSDDDFAALDREYLSYSTGTGATKKSEPTPAKFGLNQLGLREPNTLAYALCDSPTGLLVFVMKSLRILGPRMNFTQEQILTFTELAWLPGPEYAMRFWAHCAAQQDDSATDKSPSAAKPKVAITVFMGGKDAPIAGEGVVSDGEGPGPLVVPRNWSSWGKYVCPAWGNPYYEVVHTQRATGKPGLLAWERPELIATGVRGLARQVLQRDKRLMPPPAEATTAPLEQVVVQPNDSGEKKPDPGPAAEMPQVEEQKEKDAAGDKQAEEAVSKPDEGAPTAEASEIPKTTSPNPLGNGKGKGKELEVPRDPFSEGATPDTLVSTPLLEK
jgi:hypothetical protein